MGALARALAHAHLAHEQYSIAEATKSRRLQAEGLLEEGVARNALHLPQKARHREEATDDPDRHAHDHEDGEYKERVDCVA